MVNNSDAAPLASKSILLLTPFHRSQRGNSLTSERIQSGLKQMGWKIDLLSLEDDDWERDLQNAVGSNQYSLIHGFHGLHFAGVLQKAPALKKLPLVLTMTGTDINFDLTGSNQNIVLGAMKTVKKIVVFNEHFVRKIAAAHPVFKNKLLSIPQGVKLEDSPAIDRQQLGLCDEDFVVLLPSGMRRVKNIDLALDALEDLWKEFSNLRLIIMGASIDDTYADIIMKRVDTLPWAACLGEIPHEKIKAYYLLGDLVLNTSLAEGQPQAALEAMSLGIPAIMTPVPGNMGILENSIHGFYADGRSELLEAVKQLIQDDQLRKEMGTAAQQLVKKKYLPENELRAHAALYSSLL